MQINFKAEDLVMILLNGDMCNHVPVPLVVGDLLKSYDPKEEYYHLERDNTCQQYYDFYSIFGWKNEQRRREYLVTISLSKKDEAPKSSKAELLKQLQEATISGKMFDALNIQKKITELYP